jgi:hypothetical protein
LGNIDFPARFDPKQRVRQINLNLKGIIEKQIIKEEG